MSRRSQVTDATLRLVEACHAYCMSRGLGMPRIWQWSEADRRAGLPKPSLVKVGKLVTIDQRWVRQHLGRVPPTTRHNISTMLRRILEA